MPIKEFLENLKSDCVKGEALPTPLYFEYGEPKANKKEMLRYAGVPLASMNSRCLSCEVKCGLSAAGCSEEMVDSEVQKRLEESLKLTKDKLTYRVAAVCVEIGRDEDGFPVLPFEQHSLDLKKNLEGCRAVIIFAATIGSGIDMLIRRYERTMPATGLMLQGIGAERVESLCDEFNEEVDKLAKEVGLKTHPRYSPGYGDLNISVQPHILKLVNAEKRLGITLNGSFLMSPSKSVTAIIGIE